LFGLSVAIIQLLFSYTSAIILQNTRRFYVADCKYRNKNAESNA